MSDKKSYTIINGDNYIKMDLTDDELKLFLDFAIKNNNSALDPQDDDLYYIPETPLISIFKYKECNYWGSYEYSEEDDLVKQYSKKNNDDETIKEIHTRYILAQNISNNKYTILDGKDDEMVKNNFIYLYQPKTGALFDGEVSPQLNNYVLASKSDYKVILASDNKKTLEEYLKGLENNKDE